MWGAVIGDLAGSIYEYSQIKKVSNIEVKELISDNSFYSDDTILTIVILDGMLNNKNFKYYLKKYGRDYMNYKPGFKPYFDKSFSPGFIKWLNSDEIGYSKGNGAMMRISSVGYLSNSIDDVYKNSIKATSPSHNSNEALDSATMVALIIYLARCGYNKEKIIEYLDIKLSFSPFKKFNSTCYETITNCLYALFNSNSYEESVKKVISYGGDTDTNGAIVGSMAEALYGIDNYLIRIAREKIPSGFCGILDRGYSKIKCLKK